MKRSPLTFIVLLILSLSGCNNSNKKEISKPIETNISIKDEVFDLNNYDLSKVYFPDSIYSEDGNIEKSDPLGFIGHNYQRFQIHFSDIEKVEQENSTYLVKGKTKVKDFVCGFQGKVTVLSVEVIKDSVWMLDALEPVKNITQVTIKSKVKLEENTKDMHSGYFEGILTTNAYIDSNKKIHYNSFMFFADGFSNNQFEGHWTKYNSQESKICNWGDYRIPNCGDLDIGAGEFGVNEMYKKNGWQNYTQAWAGDPDDEKVKKARKIEQNKWWE